MEVLYNTGLMAFYALFFVWARAIWTLATRPDVFAWAVFFSENRNRLLMALIGCFLAGTAYYIDPTGVANFIDQFSNWSFDASRAGTGLAIGYFALWFNKFDI